MRAIMQLFMFHFVIEKEKKTDLIVNSFHDLVKTVREAKKLFVFNKKIKI